MYDHGGARDFLLLNMGYAPLRTDKRGLLRAALGGGVKRAGLTGAGGGGRGRRAAPETRGVENSGRGVMVWGEHEGKTPFLVMKKPRAFEGARG